MATIKIPYGGTTYPLYMHSQRITTPSLIVAGQGYIPLYRGGNIGDPVLLWGAHILKKAPMKIAGNGTWYRPTWYHEQIGKASCIVYYKATHTLHEGTQTVTVCTKTNRYSQCIAYGNQTQYRYYYDTNSNIYIGGFSITNGDLRIVINSMTCLNHNVNNTWSSWYSTNNAWGGWTDSRWSNYPSPVGYTLNTTATGTYTLQININNNWVTIKTGKCSCPVKVAINNTSQQQQTVTLTLS